MKLLIDIGNSRLKWATDVEGALVIGGIVDYRIATFIEDLRQAWLFSSPPRQIALASVASDTVLHAVLDLCRQYWPDVTPQRVRSSARAHGVSNAYQQPERLGVDRWLGMLAAYHEFADACCVVDCGTAITLDVVSKTGQHLGGLIAPGLRMMSKALIADTALLNEVQHPSPMMLGNITGQAIANGTLLSAVGLIEATVARWAPTARVILTGGDAETVMAALSLDASLDRLLVFKGLALLCAEADT